MTRYFCDRCHREIRNNETLIRSPIRVKIVCPSGTVYNNKIIELCRDYKKVADDIEEKFESICADMWKEFMNGGGEA